ncbi:MAG: hypothetical protein COT81_05125 [Candidatus Buchananbacteria bacterium CG10_big_fil_rev_8_21_14_0_10_42_9]|uniref:Uncharacterized protein n=1 Tax=Candidatus Buchananbacteria bacterium CG10_big_fil_rev_8_21_14_0_10_42_9 TaxID=1974526 RepID=A0A2H0VZY4_9BACT|nr:MAG: hypothetical protein COT81_05125 [Candidatus Buchananbacteria bacterium CG10_big_fil_rev_8_21_14_0_10_42_9]
MTDSLYQDLVELFVQIVGLNAEKQIRAMYEDSSEDRQELIKLARKTFPSFVGEKKSDALISNVLEKHSVKDKVET